MHAVDRQIMAKQFIRGGPASRTRPASPPSSAATGRRHQTHEYDPAKAKALLAEAGYPNGFDTELVSYLLPQIERGGAELPGGGRDPSARHLQLQAAAVVRAASKAKTRWDTNWGSYSINDVSAFLPYMFTGGAADYTRDPEVQRPVETAAPPPTPTSAAAPTARRSAASPSSPISCRCSPG